MLSQDAFINSIVTICCSYLSLVGSVLVLLSYFIARRKSTPKAAYLILHLAASDFFWFLCAAVESTYWLSRGSVPTNICFVCSPTVIFTRMASLLWTCAISFNVLMSVEKRKWSWKTHEETWDAYKWRYYIIIFTLAAPGMLLSIVKQHESAANFNLGCDPGYEKLGLWYEVFFVELVPILLGFTCNCYVYYRIRNKMKLTAFPQSVRKRRKRIMYFYIIVCIVCWIPTIVFYLVELMGVHVPAIEFFARTSLYISGFLNFLVFGMQDPHLKRSFTLCLHWMGLSYIVPRTSYYRGRLKTTDFEKTVMFEEATISQNADVSKDKKNIYRYHKLSKDDKKSLYAARPDLDPKLITTRAAPAGSGGADGLRDPLLPKKRGGLKKTSQFAPVEATAAATAASPTVDETGHNSDSSQHSLSVLSGLVGVPDSMDRLAYENSLAEALSPFHVESGASTSSTSHSGGGNSHHVSPSSSYNATSASGNSSSSGSGVPVVGGMGAYKQPSPSTSVPRDSSEITMGHVDAAMRLSVLSSTNDSTSSEDNRVSEVEAHLLEDSTASLLVHHSGNSSSQGSSSGADSGAGGEDAYDDGHDTDESSDDESDEEDKMLNEPVH